MPRIDLSKTIRQIDFRKEVWEWIDLFGEIVVKTEREAVFQEKTFQSDTPFKKILLSTINKDLATLRAIYILLRRELIHQASSYVRLLCDGLITLKYISLEAEPRSELFWGYADIEGCMIATSLLEWEGSTANPTQLSDLKQFRRRCQNNIRKQK